MPGPLDLSETVWRRRPHLSALNQIGVQKLDLILTGILASHRTGPDKKSEYISMTLYLFQIK